MSALDNINVRRLANHISQQVGGFMQDHIFEFADDVTVANIKENVRSYVSALEDRKALKNPKVEACLVRKEWEDLYPTYGKWWLAQLTDLLEKYKIIKGAHAYGKDPAVPFKWYHHIFSYKLKVATYINWDGFPEELMGILEGMYNDEEYLNTKDTATREWVEQNTFTSMTAEFIRPYDYIKTDIFFQPVMSIDVINLSVTLERGE